MALYRSAGIMLAHRLRHWPNIIPTPGEPVVFNRVVGSYIIIIDWFGYVIIYTK